MYSRVVRHPSHTQHPLSPSWELQPYPAAAELQASESFLLDREQSSWQIASQALSVLVEEGSPASSRAPHCSHDEGCIFCGRKFVVWNVEGDTPFIQRSAESRQNQVSELENLHTATSYVISKQAQDDPSVK